jgi:hypothetical protein
MIFVRYSKFLYVQIGAVNLLFNVFDNRPHVFDTYPLANPKK